MNTIVERVNSAAAAFVDFAMPMLIQSAVLILLLLLLDFLLRKRVRAVFRYWIWMLVLIKLVLPVSLSSPVSVGSLVGDKIELAQISPQIESTEPGAQAPEPRPQSATPAPDGIVNVSAVRPIERSLYQRATPADVRNAGEPPQPQPAIEPATVTWRAVVFLLWLAIVTAMTLLLVQRVLFVRALLARSVPAGAGMQQLLDRCIRQMKLHTPIRLRVCINATTPAVCGLLRPTILMPYNLAPTLSPDQLRPVLLHELVHVKRRDLWINLAQTLIQIAYFYNPLLWLANAKIRRIREQAVDEAVLVAMGGSAQQYPQTLLDVARLAFKRPALSLRLIGVVESKGALTARIKHMLSRPFPKTARLGLLGFAAIIIGGAVLLPMARGGWWGPDYRVEFTSLTDARSAMKSVGNKRVLSKQYNVKFAKGEDLFIVAELYQTGKPMRPLGYKILRGSEKPQDLAVEFTREFEDEARKIANCGLNLQCGNQVLSIPRFVVETDRFYPGTNWNAYTSEGFPEDQQFTKFEMLLAVGSQASQEHHADYYIWMPGYNGITQIRRERWCVLVKMIPASLLEYLEVEPPIQGSQILDGTCMEKTPELAPHRAVAEQYRTHIMQKARSCMGRGSRTYVTPTTVISWAEQQARKLNHAYVGTEHVLLALASRNDNPASAALQNLGLDASRIETEMLKLIRPGSTPSPQTPLPQMPRLQTALDYAAQQAKLLGHNYTGAEHLLLGMLSVENCLAARILDNMNLSQRDVRLAVLALACPLPAEDKPAEDTEPDTGLYEKAKGDSDLDTKVGPTRFKVVAAARYDRTGRLTLEDGRGNESKNVQVVTRDVANQAPWMDVADIFLSPDPNLFDVLELRIFDHKTRQLLRPDANTAVGYEINRGVVNLRSVGRPLPDTIDLWMRILHNPKNSPLWKINAAKGASTKLDNGSLLFREVRDGRWSYSISGQASYTLPDGNTVSLPQMQWTKKHDPQDKVCTAVFDFLNVKQGWFSGKEKYQIAAVAKDGTRYVPDTPHFIGIVSGTVQIIEFDLPAAEISRFEIRPFHGRDRFYFKGLKLPAATDEPLAPPPFVTIDTGGKETDTTSSALSPATLRVQVLKGKRATGTAGRANTGWVKLAAPPYENTDSMTTIIYKLTGLSAKRLSPTCYDAHGRPIADKGGSSRGAAWNGHSYTVGFFTQKTTPLQNIAQIRFSLTDLPESETPSTTEDRTTVPPIPAEDPNKTTITPENNKVKITTPNAAKLTAEGHLPQQATVDISIVPTSPIRSAQDFFLTYRVNASTDADLKNAMVDLQFKSIDTGKPATVLPIEIPYLDEIADTNRFPDGLSGTIRPSGNQLRAISQLPDGDYSLTLAVNAAPCSNVARLTINSSYDPSSAETIELVPLPDPRHVGLRATGPDPQDPDLTNMAVAFPEFVVDGVTRKLTMIAWTGPVAPLQPGWQNIRIIDLTRYEPKIDLTKIHTVKAIVGKYQSQPVTIPPENNKVKITTPNTTLTADKITLDPDPAETAELECATPNAASGSTEN